MITKFLFKFYYIEPSFPIKIKPLMYSNCIPPSIQLYAKSLLVQNCCVMVFMPVCCLSAKLEQWLAQSCDYANYCFIEIAIIISNLAQIKHVIYYKAVFNIISTSWHSWKNGHSLAICKVDCRWKMTILTSVLDGFLFHLELHSYHVSLNIHIFKCWIGIKKTGR